MLVVPHKLVLQSFKELVDLKSYVFLIPIGRGTRQYAGDLGSECSASEFVGHRLDLSRRDLVLL